MTPEQVQALQYIASLPLQAILLIACINLWKALVAAQNARVEDMKQFYEKSLGDLRLRIHLLEDKAGMPHAVAGISDEKPVLSKFGVKDNKLD